MYNLNALIANQVVATAIMSDREFGRGRIISLSSVRVLSSYSSVGIHHNTADIKAAARKPRMWGRHPGQQQRGTACRDRNCDLTA